MERVQISHVTLDKIMFNRKIKYGFDFHGVINRCPEYFGSMFFALIAQGYEVHIITGAKIEDIRDFLETHNIMSTHLYSITDELLAMDYSYTIGRHGRPLFDSEVWDRAKAAYCKHSDIDIMYDDSEIYGKYFENLKTIYCKVF